MLLACVAVSAAAATGNRTAACRTIADHEALDAMGAGAGVSGFGHNWPIRQIPGARKFSGREISCEWHSSNGLGSIGMAVNVLPSRAEATRYYVALLGRPCPRADRVRVGAGACGSGGELAAHWGRFFVRMSGALATDGSYMPEPVVAQLARNVFSRASSVFPVR